MHFILDLDAIMFLYHFISYFKTTNTNQVSYKTLIHRNYEGYIITLIIINYGYLTFPWISSFLDLLIIFIIIIIISRFYLLRVV